MIRKSLAFILIGFVVGIITGEAQTPAPGAKGETKNFSFFFDGDGSYLGVQTEEITKDNFAKYGLREVRGVAVEKVIEGSPAEKAGIQNGDVIVRFNNEEVTSVRKLTRLLGEVAADHQAKLTVIRGGGEREITATLGRRPSPKFDEGSHSWSTPQVPNFSPSIELPPMPKWDQMPRVEALPPGAPDQPFMWHMRSGRRIGVGVTPLTKQLSEHFGVTGGVMINDVRADSPAAKAGLKAGDIIVEAEGKEVKGDVDLIRVIGEKKEGDVTLTIMRQGNRQTVRVTPEKMDGEFNFNFEAPVTPVAPIAPQQFKFAIPATPLPPMTEFRFPGRVL
jgi:serine protease Do